jgi:hypothetical protein
VSARTQDDKNTTNMQKKKTTKQIRKQLNNFRLITFKPVLLKITVGLHSSLATEAH